MSRESKMQWRYLIWILLVAVSQLYADNSDLDRQLIEHLRQKDVDGARQVLEAGANPEAVLGTEVNDRALCTAIDDRGTELLELLLDYGASPNFNSQDGRGALRTPLACSIDLYNPAAFDLLLEKGADPDANLCSECAPKWRHTALTEALAGRQYPMALRIVQISEVDELEMVKLVRELGRPAVDYHPWSDEREALIEWVFEQGIDFTPGPAGGPLPGHEPPDCVFSTRDQMEGLEKGTICD